MLQVCDVGGGTGFCTLGVVETVKPENVTLVDQSPHQLSKAKAKPALQRVTIKEVCFAFLQLQILIDAQLLEESNPLGTRQTYNTTLTVQSDGQLHYSTQGYEHFSPAHFNCTSPAGLIWLYTQIVCSHRVMCCRAMLRTCLCQLMALTDTYQLVALSTGQIHSEESKKLTV